MNSSSFHAMADELEKLSGIADRDYVRDRAREGATFAKKNWGKFKGWFNRQNTVRQSAIIGGIAGGASGAVKGALNNAPKIDWDTGEMRRPGVLTRAGRAASGAVVGGTSGAALSAGTSYMVRKLTHA